MFKEIETEFLSILSDDTIEKIAHMPTKEIAKTMELIYDIKFVDIERVYSENLDKITRMVIVYNSEKEKKITHDMCPIKGKVHEITFIPSSILDKGENNAIALSKAIINYIGIRVGLISSIYENFTTGTCLLNKVYAQAVPVITCAIMRKLYGGPSLSKVIYMSLTEMLDGYKELYSEEGINSVLNLFDEGLGISELLDSGFICSIKPDDKKYPGIWKNTKEGEQ